MLSIFCQKSCGLTRIFASGKVHHMDGRRLLQKFIREHTTQVDFARAVKCSQTHLTLVLQGKRGVSVPLAKRMSAATGGTVPLKALVPREIANLLSEAAA
jgi:transcriptional regulator with XRE-family HTH domain